MAKNNVTHQEFFTLCEDVQKHPNEYQGVSVERRTERASKVLKKPVSDFSVKNAAKAVGVKLTASRTVRPGGPYKSIRDDVDQLKQRVAELEDQVAKLLEMQTRPANGYITPRFPYTPPVPAPS